MKPPSSSVLGGLDQHGAGAVAEQHAGVAVGVVDDAAHGVGADHQHFLVRAGGDQVRAGGQPVDEAGAGRDQVEAPGALRAELFCTRQAVEGKNMSGVTVQTRMASSSGGVDAALRQRALGRFDRHIGGGHVRVGDMPLRDPGALQNPLIVGLDHLFEIVIGQDARRRIAT